MLVGDLPSVFETQDDVDMSVDDPSNDFTMKELNNDQLASPQKSFSKPVPTRKHTATLYTDKRCAAPSAYNWSTHVSDFHI